MNSLWTPNWPSPGCLKDAWRDTTAGPPQGTWKKTLSVIWKCALIFSLACILLPFIQMIPKVILRNLQSWFTTRPRHLNQVSQWGETKVQHQSGPREGRAKRRLTVVLFWLWFRWRATPLFSCFIRFLLQQRLVRGVTPCIKLPMACILAGTVEAVRGLLLI